MQTHNIKILEHFADAVLSGEKCFEVRENDRGYQKGDLVKFTVVDKCGYGYKVVSHPLNEWKDHTYQITYVLGGWGLKDNYVVFGIKEYDCTRYLEFTDKEVN